MTFPHPDFGRLPRLPGRSLMGGSRGREPATSDSPAGLALQPGSIVGIRDPDNGTRRFLITFAVAPATGCMARAKLSCFGSPLGRVCTFEQGRADGRNLIFDVEQHHAAGGKPHLGRFARAAQAPLFQKVG